MTELFTKRTQAIVDNTNHGYFLVKLPSVHNMLFAEQREIREVFTELDGSFDASSKVWTFAKANQVEVERCLNMWSFFPTYTDLGQSKLVFNKTIFGINNVPLEIPKPVFISVAKKKKVIAAATKPIIAAPNTSLVTTVSELQKAISEFYKHTGFGRVKMNKELSKLVSMNVPSQSPVLSKTIFP